MFGYHGRVLLVDATHETARQVSISETVYQRCLGGSGLGCLILCALEDAATTPGSTDSALVFAFSPLVGSPITTSAKFAVTCRSPLTGFINDSMASSRFALDGKRTGFDAIVIQGAAPEPRILTIDGTRVRFHDAHRYWGMRCSETNDALKTDIGNDYSFAVIGPAGENRVRFASISHDGRHAGRGGGGAVMGAKGIKAIGVRGDARTKWADADGLVGEARQLAERSWGPATAKYRELGTLSNLLVFNRLQTLPTRNFQQSSFEGAESLAPETSVVERERVRNSCAACTIGCEHIYPLSPDSSKRVRLEYESMYALGPLCGIEDSQAVLEASLACDELGMDTISMGVTMAFAMECVQRGWLDADHLNFGNSEGLLRAINETANRQHLGDLLAEGCQRFSQHLGNHTAPYAAHVKGLELPGYDPRKLKTMALGLAVCARGADHNRSGAYEADFADSSDGERSPEQIARSACETEDRSALMDSLILCKFVRGCLDDFWVDCGRILNRVTGWELNSEALMTDAALIVDLKKLFNEQAGWVPNDDLLPDRFFSDSDAEPPGTINRSEFRRHVESYYRERGWSTDGRLRTDRVDELQQLIRQTKLAFEQSRPSD